MSAEINWDFAVEQHTKTIMRLAFEEGREAADKRCDDLGLSEPFKRRLIDNIKGEDERGRRY
jgi:hypothetical protein